MYEQWYSSQGALVANDWQNLNANVARITDQYRTDPLGNTTWRKTSREGAELIPGEYPEFENVYQPTAGRLTMSRKILPANPPSEWVPDSTTRAYDASGNVTHGYHRVGKHVPDGTPTVGEEEESRSYYSADDRLVALQKYVVRNTGEATTGGLFYQNAGVWEEYRYDPLGRRILVRTRADGGMCGVDAWTCTSSVTRFVWAGDQLLWELKVPGQEGANLESTSASGNAYGQVSYTHATGIDRPLVITKNGTSIVPHQNWRGQFAKGTYASGPNAGWVSDCASYPAQNCVPIQWPGERTTVYHELTKDGNIQNWFGGLVDGMRDASGQMYMRNRYYDPATGQFTQTDPIGLAGGLNAYGFANGDPVTYSDPYGLCPEIPGTTAPCSFFAVVMGEARGASRDFQVGVAIVIRNRATAVGGDYERVIWASGQFDAMSPDDPNNGVVQGVLFNGTVTQQVRDVVEGVYTGQIGDTTSGALLYYSPQSMNPPGRRPGWNFGQLTQTLDLGSEGKFYKCKSGTSCWQRPATTSSGPHASGGHPVPEDEK